MSQIPPVNQIPTPNMNLTCPHCRAQLSVVPSQAGTIIDCPNCQGKFQAPMPTAGGMPGAGFGPGASPEAVAFASSKKVAAGLCGILLGSLGVHKFILGFNTAGAIMLVCSLVGICGSIIFFPVFLTMAMSVVGLVEGILYLTKPDQEFYELYAIQKKEWF